MSFDLSTATGTSGPAKVRPLAKAGAQPARVCQLIDLGVQERSYQGQSKPPVRQVLITFELVNDEHKNEETGEAYRLFLSPKRFNFLNNEKATLTKFLASIDPENECGSDLRKLINKPCLVTVIHNKKKNDKNEEKTYANFGGVIPPPEGYPIKELLAEPLVFEFDNPTAETLKRVPRFIRDDLKKAINYAGSKLEQVMAEVEAEIAKDSDAKNTTNGKAPY